MSAWRARDGRALAGAGMSPWRARDGRALAGAVRLAGPRTGRLALAALLGAGAIGAAVALLATAGYLVSRASQRPETILVLTVAIVGVRVFAITRALLRYGERLITHDLAFRVMADLRRRFFARLAPLVPGDLGTRSGDLLSRFVADVDRLQDLYVRALVPPAVALVSCLGAALAAWLLVPAAGAILLAGLATGALAAPALAGAASRSAGRRQAPARAALAAELVEALDGARELAVAGRAPDRVARIDAADADLRGIAVRDAWSGGLAAGSGALVAGLTLAGVTAAAVAAADAGALDGVLLAAVVFIAMAAFEAVAPLPAAAAQLAACARAAARVDEVISAAPSVADPARPVPVPAGGALALERVSSHGLDGVDLVVAAGRTTALVGPSGAGKTTLAELLVRFRDPQRGRVTLGGVDLRELRQDDLRAAVALVDQDAHLFTTTIRENLALARRAASETDLRAALNGVGLLAWVDGLPDGLDTLVGEHGAQVSGGQRRRLAAARALLSDARLLIVDEPAAHLDDAAAGELQRTLARAAGDRGLLLITHSPAGLEAYDEVVELRGGRRQPSRTAITAAPSTRPARRSSSARFADSSG